MSRAVAITCKGVSKYFALLDRGNSWKMIFGRGMGCPAYKALQNVSFEVPKGQFVGVLGRNGSGKSTLLRVLGGVYPPDAGHVSTLGSLSAIYELGLAGNPHLSGRAYADRILTVHGFSRRKRAEMLEEIQDFAELGMRFDDPILTYSAGMKARIFFATATAGSYDIYLLDEVLSVGDQHFQAKCWRRLRDQVSRGASGVLVTHDWSAIVKICQTAHVLDRGQIVFTGPAEIATRMYLHGDSGRASYPCDNARLLSRPEGIIFAVSGEDFILSVEAEIRIPGDVLCTFAIEQLQPGFGWETVLMTRKPELIGKDPGRYRIELRLPRLPLRPGSYQMAVHLGAHDTEISGRLRLLDGWGWLNGNGLPLEVVGDAHLGSPLPVSWSRGVQRRSSS